MFRNYVKTAWRNLRKNKFYTGINIFGLAIGLAVGIMILLWVQDEFSYNRFHRNADNIYKINSHIGSGTSAQVWQTSPSPLAVFSKQSIPEVAEAVRMRGREPQLLSNGKTKIPETNCSYVDPSFFKVFSFEMLKGDVAKPFKDDNSVVVTTSTAIKYFGTDDVLGKTLSSDRENYVISGVVKDFPQNSTIQYAMLFPMSLYAKNFGGNFNWKTIDEDLGNYDFFVYLQLQPGASPGIVAKKLTKIFTDKKNEDPKDNFFTLQSLRSLHLVGADGNTAALLMTRIFLAIAIFILVIACINYVNLSTARAMIRAKEVSMRKIIGANRLQLFMQFIIESAVLFIIASLLAFLIIYLLLPVYNNISGKQLNFNLQNPDIWLVIGCSIAGTLILGSFYPALLLTSFKPLQVLKGKLSIGIGTTSFRKTLVVAQFVFSVILISGTIVITKQLQFIREKDLGYDKTQVFAIGLTDKIRDHYAAMQNDLLKQTGIIGVASSNDGVIGTGSTTGDTDWDGKEEGSSFLVHPNGIDKNFIPLLKMQFAAGGNFTGVPADSAHIILNETAVKQAGIKDPVGKTFTLWDTRATIIGVVKDYNYASLKQAVEPLAFYYNATGWLLYVKTTGKDAAKAIAATQATWKKYEPEFPFKYSFLDDDYNRLYQSDEKMGLLIKIFATVAIVISCLGLFGLITFTAQLKTKEIGIRKVLGASVPGITTFLAKEFLLLVLIAFVVATPVAWIFMNKWLQDFAYRIPLNWWMFALAGMSAIVIALITVSSQAIKAALANPVESLRAE